MGGFNLQELMSQAKRQYEVLQKKMEETVVEGSSGGGSVVVKMDGRKQVLDFIESELSRSEWFAGAEFSAVAPVEGTS